MVKKEKFPFFRQLDYRDCGPTCLRMVAKFHGKTFSREFLRDKAGGVYCINIISIRTIT